MLAAAQRAGEAAIPAGTEAPYGPLSACGTNLPAGQFQYDTTVCARYSASDVLASGRDPGKPGNKVAPREDRPCTACGLAGAFSFAHKMIGKDAPGPTAGR